MLHGLRTEGSGPGHEAAAVGIGVFIGCLPFFGFHLVLCWIVGTALRLNRLKLYLAANISNPIVAPFLIFAELQVGSWLRRGTFHPVTLEAVKAAGVATLGVDLLLGGLTLGSTLAALAAWGTYATLRGSDADDRFVELVRRASDRYVRVSITAWEFARGKLRNDPVYRAAVFDGLLCPSPALSGLAPATYMADPIDRARTLADVGCGQGLMLALLAEVGRDVRAGTWTDAAAPPQFSRLIGIETRPRVAAIAREALGDDAEILTLDARGVEMPRAHTVLLFDVLHLMSAGDQESLLAALIRALEPDGVIVVREADASAGWRFATVRLGNRLKALAIGRWRQTFHFRSTSEWIACFERLGLRAEVRQMGKGTPFGNVLFRVTR